MVVDSASGFLSAFGGFGSLHAKCDSTLALHVLSQVARRDAMASANDPPRFHLPAGPVGSIAGGRHRGLWHGGGGSYLFGVGAAGRARQG